MILCQVSSLVNQVKYRFIINTLFSFKRLVLGNDKTCTNCSLILELMLFRKTFVVKKRKIKPLNIKTAVRLCRMTLPSGYNSNRLVPVRREFETKQSQLLFQRAKHVTITARLVPGTDSSVIYINRTVSLYNNFNIT